MSELVEAIDNYLDDEKLKDLFNQFVSDMNYPKYEIYDIEQFNEFHKGDTPLEIVELVQDTNFYPGSDYYNFDSYGVLTSDCAVIYLIYGTGTIDEFVDWIRENSHNLDLPEELSEIINSQEEVEID